MADDPRFQAHEDKPEPPVSPSYVIVYSIIAALILWAVLVVVLSSGNMPQN